MFEDDNEVRGRVDGRKIKNGTKKSYKDKLRYKNKNGKNETEVVDEQPKKKWSGKDYKVESSEEEEVEEKKEEVKEIKEYGKNLGIYVREEEDE